MAIMELHINPIRQGDEIVGEVVHLPANPPSEHIFRKDYVDQMVERGLFQFEGKEQGVDLVPDPLGPMKGASGLTMKFPGDKLTFRATIGDSPSPVKITYRITHFPIPQYFRHLDTRQRANDESESEGVRIAPEYAVELISNV